MERAIMGMVKRFLLPERTWVGAGVCFASHSFSPDSIDGHRSHQFDNRQVSSGDKDDKEMVSDGKGGFVQKEYLNA